MPHAYMYNRALDAADSVSLAYPNLNNDGASSVYYASLTSSVHKMQGTRKRATMMDDMSSVQMESIMDAFEEEDPEEILRRKRSAAKKLRNARDRSTSKIE